MDINAIHEIVKAQRRVAFENSPKLTLGELIAKLEAVPDEKKDKTVQFDFEYAYPTTLTSWRGIYAELALGGLGI